MTNYLLVALGSAAGGMARYACSGIGVRLFGETFPWGTLFVNVSGSLAIGALAALMPEDGRIIFVPDARALLMVGVCGGFTTFSSFSMEVVNLMRNGAWAPAIAYVIASVVLCLLAAAAAFFALTALQR
ncbi:MAG: fluoride efflux transporter CrcB [Gammaproteobacteria bacterium]|jgi:CrcB protein